MSHSSWRSQHCQFCNDAEEVFPDMLSLWNHCQRYHSEIMSKNPGVQRHSSATPSFALTNATAAMTGATASQDEARKPASRSMVGNESPDESSFPELNGFARVFIVDFNMLGSDTSVEQVAALSEDAKSKLTAYVPSHLYLTNHGKRAFKKKLRGGKGMKKDDVDSAHARTVLSKFYLRSEDADNKISHFVHEKRKLKGSIAKCIRETMQQALLSKVRLADNGKYKSIPSWNELLTEFVANADLQRTAFDLLNRDVYPKGTHSEYRRDVLASQLTKSCRFVFNDAKANKDFISLHVTEMWSEISQKLRKASTGCAATEITSGYASVPLVTNSHPSTLPPGAGSTNAVMTNINETGLEVSCSATQSLDTNVTSLIALQNTSLALPSSLSFSDDSRDKSVSSIDKMRNEFAAMQEKLKRKEATIAMPPCMALPVGASTKELGRVNEGGLLEVDATIAMPTCIVLPVAASTKELGRVNEGGLEVVPNASLPPYYSNADPFSGKSDDTIEALMTKLKAKEAIKKKVEREGVESSAKKEQEQEAKKAQPPALKKKQQVVLPPYSNGDSSSEESVGSFAPSSSNLNLEIDAAFKQKQKQEAKLKAQQEAAGVRNEVHLMTEKKQAVALEKKRKKERSPAPLKKKPPAVVAVTTKKTEPDEASGIALLGEVVATKTNQTKGHKKPTAKAAAKKEEPKPLQETKDQVVEKRFVCQIHRQGYIDLTALVALKAYLKSSTRYDLTTLLTNSCCHNCSKPVGDHDSCLYYCLSCKNELCLPSAVEDESPAQKNRPLPWLCQPCYVAEAGPTGGGKKSTRKRKQTSKAQENY